MHQNSFSKSGEKNLGNGLLCYTIIKWKSFLSRSGEVNLKFAHDMGKHHWSTRDACLRLLTHCKQCYLIATCLIYLHLVCSLASMLFKTIDLMPFIRSANSSVMIPRPCASLALVDDMQMIWECGSRLGQQCVSLLMM